MPFINVKVSEELNSTQIESIKTKLGKAISLIQGKSEAYLMVNIEDNCNLYFKGDNSQPTSFTDVNIFGSTSKSDCEKLTKEICNILSDIIGVPPNRSYVKFLFSDLWGYNGFMF